MLQADVAECKIRTEQLRAELENLPIDISKEKPIYITASFGIALLDGDISLEQNIEHADQAMYDAKKSGRNCIKIWNENIIDKT